MCSTVTSNTDAEVATTFSDITILKPEDEVRVAAGTPFHYGINCGVNAPFERNAVQQGISRHTTVNIEITYKGMTKSLESRGAR